MVNYKILIKRNATNVIKKVIEQENLQNSQKTSFSLAIFASMTKAEKKSKIFVKIPYIYYPIKFKKDFINIKFVNKNESR